MAPLQKEMGELITWDRKKFEVLNNSFALVFTGKCSKPQCQVAEGKAGTGRMKDPPTVGVSQV